MSAGEVIEQNIVIFTMSRNVKLLVSLTKLLHNAPTDVFVFSICCCAVTCILRQQVFFVYCTFV